jgi:hypothetical protein
VTREIPVSPIVDPLDLLPPEGKSKLDVQRGLAVVSQFVLLVRPSAQRFRIEAKLPVESEPLVAPVIEPLL